MKTIKLNVNNWHYVDDITLTIGNFDGVHAGHQTLLKKVLEDKDYKKAVMTLDPHPSKVFKMRDFYTLFDINEKETIMSKYELDYLIVADFTLDFAALTIGEFIEKLKVLGVKRLVLGSDFRFATKGSGKVSDLQKHFEVIVIDDITSNNETRISTTYIKQLLKNGKIREANKLLGYNFFISGYVEHGNKVGRTLGFPTANIDYKESFLPSNGVYFVEVLIDGVNYYGMANIGNNPTVNFSRVKKLEVFILDYNQEIYDSYVKVDFIEKIRDELKFDSVTQLIDEIKNDELKIRNIIKNKKI